MKIDPVDFRVLVGDSVNIGKWPTIVTHVYDSKARYQDIQEIQEEHAAQLSHPVPFSLPRRDHEWRASRR